MSWDPFMVEPTYESVKFPTPGTAIVGEVMEVGELRQAKDFETKAPAVWKSGRPKMQLRILLKPDGADTVALYVTQFTNLFEAIQNARTGAGAPLAVGGKLWVKYTGDVAVEGSTTLKAKGYTAAYKAPEADPFAAGDGAPKVTPSSYAISLLKDGGETAPTDATVGAEIPF